MWKLARKQYPSDHRRWFRVMEDILHHPKIRAVGHEGLATYIKILAVANQRKAHETDGIIELDISTQQLVTGKKRADSAARVLHYLSTSGLLVLHYCGTSARITLPKYAEKQGFAPTDSVQIPATTPTPTNKKVVASSRVGEPHGESSSKRSRSQEVFFGDHPLALAHPAKPGTEDVVGSQFVGEEGNSTQEWTGPESKVEPRRH